MVEEEDVVTCHHKTSNSARITSITSKISLDQNAKSPYLDQRPVCEAFTPQITMEARWPRPSAFTGQGFMGRADHAGP